jgi:hypothetical protein
MLSHTTSEAEADTGVTGFLIRKFLESFQDTFFGSFPNSTGIEENDIGVVYRFRRLIAVGFEYADEQLGIGQIHLAAVRLYVHFARIHGDYTKICCNCSRNPKQWLR